MPSISQFIRLCVALGIALISVPLLSSSASAVPDETQVVVCKYSHTPVSGEIAQTVIIVSRNALEGEGFAGIFPFTFSDEQNSSLAVRFAEVGETTGSLDEPEVECPPFPGDDACPELPGDQEEGFQCDPITETETQDVGPVLDCDAGTITTLHQERTRTQVFDEGTQTWSFGEWSDWVTVDTTVEDATAEDCPDDPIDPPNPPNPNPPAPVDPPAPTLPETGAGDYLGLGALGALLLAGASALLWRSRRIGLPQL